MKKSRFCLHFRFCLLLILFHLLSINLLAEDTIVHKFNIAVMDIEGTSGLNVGDAELLTDRLRAELFKTGLADVMERKEMNTILQEQGFQQTGTCSDDKACLVEVGQLLGVQYIISGSIGKFGSVYMVNLRSIDVETGKLVNVVSKDYKVNKENLIQYIPELAAELLNAHEKTVNDTTVTNGDTGKGKKGNTSLDSEPNNPMHIALLAKIGLNRSRLAGSRVYRIYSFIDTFSYPYQLEPEAISGLQFGFGLQLKKGKVFAFQSEVIFSTKGGSGTGSYSYYYLGNRSGETILNVNLMYLEVPLLLKLHVAKAEQLVPYFQFGIAPGLMLAARANFEASNGDDYSGKITESTTAGELSVISGFGSDFVTTNGFFNLDVRLSISVLPIDNGNIEISDFYKKWDNTRNFVVGIILGYGWKLK